MSSNINYSPINKDYPVAGIDNDSQGFRDNFTAIKNALQVASSEITVLQNVAVLKADLATQSSAVQNDLQGSTIYNGFYNQFYGVFYSLPVGTVNSLVDTNITVNLENGPMQRFLLKSNCSFSFTNWPETGYAMVRMIFVNDNPNAVTKVTFTSQTSAVFHHTTDYPKLNSTYAFNTGGESLNSITVTDPGSGYIVPATVNFTSPTLTGGTTPTATATYKVLTATPVGGQAGSGYAVGNQVVVNQNTNILLQVSGIGAGGAITSLTVVSGGELSSPIGGNFTVTALTGTGSGAAVNLNFGVKNVVITNAGDGYSTVAPTITIDIGTGTRALATAGLTSGTADNQKVVEAYTVDGGSNVYIRFIGEFN